jgi:MerR family mercuric resistance operon transcriptional regulator
MTKAMTIGRLARAAGVNVETIRYYQRRGLLDQPKKRSNGYRRYSEHVLKRVRFIKRAQTLGFTLQEIDNLLRLEQVDCCDNTRKLATRKLAMIQTKLADLTAIRDVLAELVMRCEAGTQHRGCPVIDALLHD